MNSMEVILPKGEERRTEQIAEMLQNMNDGEKNKMLIFMQGVKFAKNLAEQPEAVATN